MDAGADASAAHGVRCSYVQAGGCGSAEAAEKRLEERFGPVVGAETRGSVVLELPLDSIARRRGRSRAPSKPVTLTAGAGGDRRRVGARA
jgi:hypothetical protein